ncbi:RapZ C-terminal domain-containing protein [Frigoriflavimonas asaccharolytica]|uniref:UPF0042 nucleotide-binding protein n=1 Tax=Frigoriflavimonas asaccharolytica TaxID=2735899 RepID=A0A8J8KB40_9FLAO|nr:RNase adapter RapZ [Frigoriflavimonas asaccharolytica]NRS92164.1 UPF0042 nucleotide-binding protein [Frigoriflavimonas asaccharolytica]
MSLKIEIHSFSYKKGGIPKDTSGNGGGFAFDCRGILNPGRQPEYKELCGDDLGVQNFLETQTEMPQFFENVKNLTSITIQNYLDRDFDHLQVNFGCTGGQHRSVYSAIKFAEFVKEKFPAAEVSLWHDEQLHLN